LNIEEIRGDIFKLFDLKIDKDDPIWAFLYANKEVINNLEEILEISKKENKKYHKQLQQDMKDFAEGSKISVDNAIERFDFHIEEFNRDVDKIEKFNEDFKAFQNRHFQTTKKNCQENLNKLEELFDANIVTVEYRIKDIIDSIDYKKFNAELDKQMQSTLNLYLQEVRAGVSINKKGLEHLGSLKDDNEIMIKKLESRVSILTNLAFVQTIMFGASISFIGMIYFSQGNLNFFGNKSQVVEQRQQVIEIEK